MVMRSLYRRFVLALAAAATFVYCRRYEVVGREHMPAAGGVIVVSNHLNNADSPMVQRALPRHVVFMAKKELLDIPLVGALLRAWGVFPVRRGELDLNAVRTACRVVNDGKPLMMFPEGTRSRTGRLGSGHPGTAMIARRTGAPILPVAITGTEGIGWPGIFVKPRSVRHIRVAIGEPFVLGDSQGNGTDGLRSDADEIMRRIALLLPEEYRPAEAPAPAPQRDEVQAERR